MNHQETNLSETNRVGSTPNLDRLKANLASVIRGKQETIDVLLITLIAEGSTLMEDVPGVGKTTLAKALAISIDSVYSRVQFTPDLLPGDIVGSSVYNPLDGQFRFRKGPVFCNILLADEINRASPRTQSALLEAMSEGQSTVEGTTYTFEKPFLVLATQNPVEYHGTYPLPEAQLDRFMTQLNLGYPNVETEVDILYAQADHHPLTDLNPVISKQDVVAMQRAARATHIERNIARYVVDIIDKTRRDERIKLGVSPRASIMLFNACKAAAYYRGRDYVEPDDVQYLAPYLLPHRIMLTSKAKYGGTTAREIIGEIIAGVKVPT